MSEPHELEERATVAAVAAWIEWGWSAGGKGMKELPAEAVGAMTRAVLNLVQQEQESSGNGTHQAIEWRASIRAWWLSHTAPQEK